MFSCYFDCKEAALHWLNNSEFTAAPVATLRPPYRNQEHHVMTGISKPDFSKIIEMSPREFAINLSKRPGSQLAAFFAIMNRNAELLQVLLIKFRQAHTCETLREIAAYALDAALTEKDNW